MTRAAKLVGYAEPGTPEWFEMRRGCITGSRIAACVGLSPWMSQYSLYWELLGLEGEPGESEAMEWGTRLEPAVVRKWADTHPNCAVRTEKTVWQSIERPWQMVSPDALVVEPGPVRDFRARGVASIVEAKTSGYQDDWGTPGTDEIPVHYRCQILWMLDTFDLEYCHVPVLFNGRTYHEYVVRRDESDIAVLRHGAVQLLDRVARRDPPPLDGSEVTYELVRKFHPEIEPRTVELPAELVETLGIAQSAASEASYALQEVRTIIADLMGTAKTARAPSPDGRKPGRKIADRRARGEGTPYVQLVDITVEPTIAREAS